MRFYRRALGWLEGARVISRGLETGLSEAGLPPVWGAPAAMGRRQDPVWIPGFSNDADHDDVVVFLTKMWAVIDRPPEVCRGSTFAFSLPVRP